MRFLYTIHEMIYFGRIVGFDWDDRQTSLDKEGVTEREAEYVFSDPKLLMLIDEEHSGDENRFHASLKPTTAISLPFILALWALKVAANRSDVPYQSLIKVWLEEKLKTE